MKQETINDILEEMRSAPFNWSYPEGIPQMQRDNDKLSEFADRIEAAHKRETVTDCNGLNGNGAKMREALAEIRLLLVRVPLSIKPAIACGIIAAKAKAALSAPARNCDLYANPKEAGDAFISKACENPCGNCTVSDECHNPLIHECGIKWLFAEAKGEAK